MVEIPRGIETDPVRRARRRELPRLAGWGLATLGALTIAAYAASSRVGEERLIMAVAEIGGTASPERQARVEREARLASVIRELSDNGNRLTARLNSLEQSVGDLTGSIARVTSAPPVAVWASPPLPEPILAVPDTVPAPESAPQPDVAAAPETVPVPQPAPDKTGDDVAAATKAEFGIDIGRANSLDGLRKLWNTLKAKHGSKLDELQPIVSMRELARSGGVELRLVAGPLPNASAAARMCAGLSGVACHPTVFDGQKLVVR